MSTRKAKLGDRVKFRYRALLTDGSEVCCSEPGKLLEICIGERRVFPAVEDALIGLEESGRVSVTLDPKEAYGEYSVANIFTIELSELPSDIDPKSGTAVRLHDSEGREFEGVITTVEKKSVTVDTNHPLAGKRLSYELTLVRFA